MSIIFGNSDERGVEVILKTLEGDVVAHYPDYIAIGKQNEVYTNRQKWVEENLEFVEYEN